MKKYHIGYTCGVFDLFHVGHLNLLERCKEMGDILIVGVCDDKMLALKKFKFDVLFSGDDWKGSDRYLRTEKQFAEYGASIEYLPYTKGISTTDIKNKMKEK